MSLTLSHASALMRSFFDDLHLPLSLRMNTGSDFLTSSIYIGAILDFSIRPISSNSSFF